MDWDLLLRAILAAGAIFAAWKVIRDLNTNEKATLREEYKFVKEFFKDKNEQKEMNSYLREKGYAAIAGTRHVKAKEVEYLLKSTDAEYNLQDFIVSRDIFERASEENEFELKYRKSHNPRWKRVLKKTWHVLVYGFSALLALFPVSFGGLFGLELTQIVQLSMFTIPIFGLSAYSALKEYSKIKKAEKLMATFNEIKSDENFEIVEEQEDEAVEVRKNKPARVGVNENTPPGAL